MPSTTAKRSYRRRIRSSRCRRAGAATCRKLPGCKYVGGPMRKFCRKVKNSRRRFSTPVNAAPVNASPRYRF